MSPPRALDFSCKGSQMSRAGHHHGDGISPDLTNAVMRNGISATRTRTRKGHTADKFRASSTCDAAAAWVDA